MENPQGLHACFISDGDTVSAEVTPALTCQGFDGVLHGGIISSLLDEALWYALYIHGFVTVTVQLEVKLRRAAVPGQRLRVQSQFTGNEHRYILAEGKLIDDDDNVVAEARGRFLPAPKLEAHLGEFIIAEPCLES
jgi:uncharacterized protein (TIGR00369 family)